MRIPAKPLGSYPFYLQPFLWNQRRKYGEVLQAALLWARAPKLFRCCDDALWHDRPALFAH